MVFLLLDSVNSQLYTPMYECIIMGKFNYFAYQNKRLEKLSPNEKESLVFDLINAFAKINNPADSALFLQDLLTENEIQNLAKRLRIAKLILEGLTHEEIVQQLHCSYATITKVRTWLDSAGEGFKRVIQKLPKRKQKTNIKKTPGFGYGLPQIIQYYLATNLETKEKKLLSGFLEELRVKTANDKDLRESSDFRK